MKLLGKGLLKFILGLALVMTLLFGSAGTFDFWQGWLFIGLLFIPILLTGILLFLKSPALLEKRLNGKEKVNTQRNILAFSALMFLAGFIIAGLDHRYGWSAIPKGIIFTASILLLISYGIYAEVLRENTYLSRIIEVREGQTVISNGLYGLVRHPMYSATIVLFLSIPLVLGSFWAFLCFIPYLPLIIIRIINEEKLLEKELEGYLDYKNKVNYRLIPFIW